MQVHWLTTDDGWNWQPVVAGPARGARGRRLGGRLRDRCTTARWWRWSATRPATAAAGARRSAGPRRPARASWRCRNDPRKFDSPLLFRAGRRGLPGRPPAPARRRRLRPRPAPPARRRCRRCSTSSTTGATPSAARSGGSTRARLEVTWQVDLPSRGDTCFAAVVRRRATARSHVYNYSSPLDGPDLPWVAGQLGAHRDLPQPGAPRFRRDF